MSPQRHVILQQTVELVVAHSEDAWPLQQEVSRVMGKARSLIEGCCDEVSSPDCLYRIDRLELNLGALDPCRLEDDLLERLGEALRHGLTEQVGQQASSAASPQLVSQYDLLARFLRHGSFPWWADLTQPSQLEQSFDRLRRDAPGPLRRLAQEVAADPPGLRRLVTSFDDQRLATLASLLAPALTAFPRILFDGLLAVATRLPLPPATQSVRHRRHVWQSILETATLSPASAAAPLDFSREVAMRLARLQAVAYPTLVEKWTGAAAAEGSPIVLREIAAALQVECLPATARPRIRQVATPRETLPATPWTDESGEALRDGLRQWIAGSTPDAELPRPQPGPAELREAQQAPLQISGPVVAPLREKLLQWIASGAPAPASLESSAELRDALLTQLRTGESADPLRDSLRQWIAGSTPDAKLPRPQPGPAELQEAQQAPLQISGPVVAPLREKRLQWIASGAPAPASLESSGELRDALLTQLRTGESANALRDSLRQWIAGSTPDAELPRPQPGPAELREAQQAPVQISGPVVAPLREKLLQWIASGAPAPASLESWAELRDVLLTQLRTGESADALRDSLRQWIAGSTPDPAPPWPQSWPTELRRALLSLGDATRRATRKQSPRLFDETQPGAGRQEHGVNSAAARSRQVVPHAKSDPAPEGVHAANQAVREWREWQEADAESRFSDADQLHLGNAGLVILWPFLSHLFARLGLLQDKLFVTEAAQQRAVALLQYLASGDDATPEYLLPLNKLLCGMALELVFELDEGLSDEERSECDNLLAAAIAQVPILNNMSTMGFRGSFLLRAGILTVRDGAWLLRVERESHDLLLERFPWAFTWVKLPWMEVILQVEW